MKSSAFSFPIWALLTMVVVLAWCGVARADDARTGAVEWSDGHKLAGAISLTPGKSLRLFTGTGQVSLSLDEVKEIRFKPEKEEMWEGFYFPNAGQATQVKTGEVYPIRYLQTQITLANGQVVEGHLFTTTLYVETDDATEKIVLMAKQTGANGQKLADLAYPTLICFDAGAAIAGSSQIDLTQAQFVPLHPPVILVQPDLAQPPMEQAPGKPIWTVPVVDPGKIIFAVEAGDGIHVAWPLGAYVGNSITKTSAGPLPGPLAEVDPMIRIAVKVGLRDMQDFYDTRTLLGSFAGRDGADIYSLVMMKRLEKTYTLSADKIPWSLVILRWKYDLEQKKVTLLNRVPLATGRAENNAPLPAVLKEPELLRDISGSK
jgi:hypothetical protein